MITGEQIPDLEVEAFHDGEVKPLALSGYRGSWLVLLFYPADFTFICPTELAEAAEHHEQFMAESAELVSGHCVDAQGVARDLADGQRRAFPDAGRPDRDALSCVRDLHRGRGRLAARHLPGRPDGVLEAFELHANSIGRAVPEMLRKLKAAAFVRAHDGQVCPASWTPGSDTLRPGLDLVGRL
jgi:peroxiredoxin (alkyl hydroperoxide reductase subunit C)